MSFWDTSAIVPLIVSEPSSGRLRHLAADEPQMIVWWSTGVECVSAVARRERSGGLAADDAADALVTLDQLSAAWHEVPPAEPIRVAARRMVRVHDLRAADAFQLAAALTASEGQPETLELVTLDQRLASAARLEGFPILAA